ncbi:MAG TPA: LysR family transcriptional regulator [Steroidobacteraceae bacterium]|jgi:LysR family glycine cleavage system transcriptional activator
MRAIQAFEAVARCGGVAAAAEELGVSPGAVSQQLRKIEEALHVRLFERNGRSLALTSWGRVYYENVRIAFDQLRRAQHVLQLARAKQGIALSALPSMAAWLRPLLLQWRSEHAGASVRLIGTDDEAVLQDERIDFRLSYGADARKYDRFAELFVDAVVPVCSPDFLRSHPVSSEADILKGPLIDIDWELRHRPQPSWTDWARAAGLQAPTVASELTFSQSSVALDAAADGGGFVLGPIAMIAQDLKSGRLVIPIDRRLSLPDPYFLAWDRDALDRPFGADFRTFIIAAARRQVDLSLGKPPITAGDAEDFPYS